MMKKRMARFPVTPCFIENALHIPKGHTIVGATWDFFTCTICLFVSGPDLPEVDEGQEVPQIMPQIINAIDGNGHNTYRWDWNLDGNNFNNFK